MISSYGFSVTAEEEETVIVMSDIGITVDGSDISQNADENVYLSEVTETHADVAQELKDVKNKVVTITKPGTYRFSGKISDAQIAVAAGEDDSVNIVFDGVDITCRTAPAVLVRSAYEPAEPGKAGVTLTLADGSDNTVTGSHTAATEEDTVKHDGAVSSNVSLLINGEGKLTVNGDTEGIGVKFKHLTVDGGTIYVYSNDDPINGSEDGVAHITINGGYVFCNAVGTEGDGIDSNGYITINGGTVIALASPNSMDSGIDSDRGSVINGGTVVGAGNMFDELDENSGQLYMFLQFSEATDDLICITDSSDNPVFAYDFPFSYSYISLSCPQLEEGTYHVYKGGEASGTQSDGLYTDISSYTKGTQMHHGGISYSTGRPGGMTPPDGMTPPEGMDVPCRNRRRGTFQS